MQSGALKTSASAHPDLPGDAGFAARAAEAVADARPLRHPFRHWQVTDVIDAQILQSVLALPVTPSGIAETYGKRDSHNDVRRFFSPAMQTEFPVMRQIAEAFQQSTVVQSIQNLVGVSLAGSYLRIEYCQDVNGFWLEPHMDLSEKLVTLQVYLNTGRDEGTLGTDLYDSQKRFVVTTPSAFGQGILFVPREPDSWHGFEKRAISHIRRSLIINYVTDEWRSRHELSFPTREIS